MTIRPWIGVDLDCTLAHYDGWRGPQHVGAPIAAMVERIQRWLVERPDVDVKIFTARVCRDADAVTMVIQDWLESVGLPRLEVTNIKDYGMLELWDDRAVQVVPNTGLTLAEALAAGVER